MTPLIISENAVFQRKLLGRDLYYIQIANNIFNLGIPPERLSITDQVETLIRAASLYDYIDTGELLYLAIAKQLSPEMKQRIGEDGLEEDRSTLHMLREIGYPELAGFMEEWFSLADQVKIVIHEDIPEQTYPEIENLDEIKEKITDLRTRRAAFLPDVPPTQAHISEMICEQFGLVPKSYHEFEHHWIAQIIASQGFAAYSPPPDPDSWSLACEPYGWLTRRHGAALMTHGYTYQFAFWEREIGDTRGHLWIQTDRGPLRLTDTTDSTSLRSNFPVQVSTIDGKALFKLRESDVPKNLLLGSKQTKPYPPMRGKKKSWLTFWR